MRKFTLAPMCAALALLAASPASAAQVVVEAFGLNPAGNTLYLAIFDSAEKFDAEDARKGVNTALTYKNVIGKATAAGMRFSFELPEGIYGLKAFYDVNGDKKLGANFLGIPNEPYGFSNNVRGVLSQPTFEDARFTVSGDTLLQITLK